MVEQSCQTVFSAESTHFNTSGNDSEGELFDYWFRVLHSLARLFSKPDEGQVHINLLTQTSVREKRPEAAFEAAAALHLTYGRAHPSKCRLI